MPAAAKDSAAGGGQVSQLVIAIGEHRFDPRVLVAQAADDVLQPSSTSTGDISDSLDDRAAASVVAGRNRRSNMQELSGHRYLPERRTGNRSSAFVST